jgi:hypothetical protein
MKIQIIHVEENMIGVTKAKSTTLLSVLLIVVAICFVAPHAQATVLTVEVGNCIPTLTHQYGTIQAAVTASNPGGTVKVCPGTYPEQVTVNTNLTIEGVTQITSGPYAAVVVPPSGGLVQNGTDIFGNPVAAQIFVSTSAGNVTISHLTVDATGNNLAGCGGPTLEGIYFQNTSGTITEDAVRNQYQTDFTDYGGCQNGLAINVESTTSNNSVTISNNSVRAYQKNGITATGAATGEGSPGPNVTISNNSIVGFGATAMNWSTPGAAENGIQVGFGAGGTVSGNNVFDNIWAPDTSSDTGDAASGILIFSSEGVIIQHNEVASAQFGIATDTDSEGYCSNSSGTTISCGDADGTSILSNKVVGTQIFDAIDLCSNQNAVQSNTLYGSTESGVHIDDTCTNSSLGTISGNNNSATTNTINEACTGVLTGTGTGNTFSPNSYANVTTTTMGGDVCSAASTAVKTRPAAQKRPSPYRPNHRK